MKFLTSGYESVFRLSQYMGEVHPEAHVKGFAGCSFIAFICNSCMAIISSNFFILQMYKIFFKDRVVYLTDKIDDDLTRDFGAIHKLGSEGELKHFLADFESNTDRQEAFIYHHNQYELLKRFRGLFKNLLAAGGFIWDKDKSHFLTMKRLGKLDLPKGKIEVNETFEEAALREVSEECGIEHPEIIRPLGPTFHTYQLEDQKILKEVRWFEMIYHGNSSPTPQLEENITHIHWTPKNEGSLFIQKTYPSIVQILEKVGAI